MCLNDASDLPTVSIKNIDKIIHFVFYFVFVFLWIKSINPISIYYFLMVVIVAIILGISIEFLQEKFTQNRVFDWYDIIANSMGAITSFIIVKSYQSIQNKNISN